MMSSSTPTKVCRSCGIPREIEAFRRLRRGSDKRVAVCRFCRRLIDQSRYRKGRDKAKRKETIEALTFMRSNRSLACRMVFFDAMIQEFGGPVQFAQAVREVFESTGDRNLKFKCLKVAVDIAEACSTDRKSLSEADLIQLFE